MSKKVYKHGIAAYPVSWRELAISENKICIQFNSPELKTRAIRELAGELIEEGHGYSLPVNTHGTFVEFLAVGISIDLHKEMLQKLLPAYKEHADKFPERSLKAFLLEFADKIKETFNDDK